MPSRNRRIAGRVLAIVVMLIVCVALWAAWYAYHRGFTKKWRGFVAEEFRKRGVDVSFSRLTIDPFQGLVARDLKIYDGPERSTVVARVDRIVLDINYANLLHGAPFLNAVDLRDASLALPLDPAKRNSRKVRIERLYARVVLPPGQIYLSHANASIEGFDVAASGRLINPQAFAPKTPQPRSERSLEAIERIFTELDSLRYAAVPPRITVRFSGDLAAPEEIFVEATIEGRDLRRKRYPLKQISAAVTYQNRVVALKYLRIEDAKGVLTATGSYETQSRRADLALRSTLDLQALARSFEITGKLDECVFYSTPAIELDARAEFGNPREIFVLGGIELSRFGVRSVLFNDLKANFSWDGSRWYVRDFHLEHRSGEIFGAAMQLPEAFRAEVESTIDPTRLLPFFSGKTAEFLSEWEFPRSPEVRLALRGPRPDPDVLQIDGEISVGRTSFRGSQIKSGTTEIHVKNRAATYRNFRLERAEGSASGTFTYDFGNKLVRLDDVRGIVDTGEVAVWIAPDFPRYVEPYKFKQPPSLRVDGVVHYKGTPGTRLVVDIDAPHGMDYVFLKKNLSSPRISGRLLFTDGRLQLLDIVGSLYGGSVRGNADIALGRGPQRYSGFIQASRVDFASVTKLYFNYGGSTGLVDGRFRFSGHGGDARRLRGSGEIRVVDGNVFAIPCLGPLSGILNGIVPGMGVSIAREASSTFTIEEGTLRTDDFTVQGKGFEMLGEGRLFFLDDKMAFNIRINARGIPGVLLFPVSKLLEYTSQGSLSKPEWRPRNLPTF